MASWWARPVVVIALGLALTAVVAWDSEMGLAYAAPPARASLETAVTVVGALVAFLVFGRFRRSRRSDDLAIALALALLALAYPLFVELPPIFTNQGKDIGFWLYLTAHAGIASLLFWAAALANRNEPRPAMTTGHRGNSLGGLWAAGSWAICTVLVCFLFLMFFGYDPDAHHASAIPAGLFNQPGVSAVRLLSSVLFLGAAMGFSRRSRTTSDGLIGWLGVGCALLAVGDFAYGLFPPVVHSALHFGDVFRLAAVLVFAIGAAAEIRSYWLDIHRLARSEVRQAIASDLHDGIAQELAFLCAHVQERPVGNADAAWLAQLRAAAERALAESRRAIVALSTDQPMTVSSDIETSVRDIATAAGVRLELELPTASLGWLDREMLVRVAREAVVNAIRHGHPSVVRVAFHDVPRPILEISDDGVGFDPASVDPRCQFGLTSMRDRAHALGGELTVTAAPGRGTCVELSWPPGTIPPRSRTRPAVAQAASPSAVLRTQPPLG